MEKPTAEQIALQFEFAGYLRNPELKQTTGELWNLATGGKCCLGHLCDFVLSKAPEPDKIGRWDLGDVYAKFEWLDADGKQREEISYPPLAVIEFMGYESPNPSLPYIDPTGFCRRSASCLNDSEELTLPQIADAFEAKAKEYQDNAAAL